MKVIMTGARGYLGNHLLPLIQASSKIIPVSLTELVSSAKAKIPLFETKWGGADVILHAGAPSISACEADVGVAQRYIEDTRLLFQWCAASPQVSRMLYLSSCSVYGRANQVDEDSVTHPTSQYGWAKLACEQALLQMEIGPPRHVLRLGTLFGGAHHPRLDLLVNRTVHELVSTGVTRPPDPALNRTFLHVADAAAVIHQLLTCATLPDRLCVGANHLNLSINEVLQACVQVLGFGVVRTPYLDDPRNYTVHFDRLQRLLGAYDWQPLQNGIQEVAAACRAKVEA